MFSIDLWWFLLLANTHINPYCFTYKKYEIPGNSFLVRKFVNFRTKQSDFVSYNHFDPIDTHIHMSSIHSKPFSNIPEFTGNDVIIPGKAIFVVENDLFQILSLLSIEWDPYRCILRGILDISKFPWIYRKWRQNSRKNEYFCWDFDSNHLYWSNEQLCQKPRF